MARQKNKSVSATVFRAHSSAHSSLSFNFIPQKSPSLTDDLKEAHSLSNPISMLKDMTIVPEKSSLTASDTSSAPELRGASTRWETLVDLLAFRATATPDKTAYIYIADDGTETHYTYASLHERAKAIGAYLQHHGYRGKTVLLMFHPEMCFIEAFFGCLYAGAIAVPGYPPKLNKSADRLMDIARSAGASLAFASEAVVAGIEKKLDVFPELHSLQWMMPSQVDSTWADQWEQPEITGNSLAFLQYTSGSTSAPKGVMVTHRNILVNEAMIQQGFGTDKKSIVVGWLPLFHDMGLIGNMLHPMFIGCVSILTPPVSFLKKPVLWLQLISKYKGTVSGGPNFAYQYCVDMISESEMSGLDLSSWEVAFNGSEPIHEKSLKLFIDKFKLAGFRHHAIYPCYGMAETTLFVSGGYANDPYKTHTVLSAALEKNRVEPASDRDYQKLGDAAFSTLVGCGHVSSIQKVKIVDPDTFTESPKNWVGEVWVQGPHVSQGYWQNSEMTDKAFKGRIADTKDGPYLRTGDLGFIRPEDGELFITGRLKELVIIRGRNYYPQDIERVAEEAHPDLQGHSSAAFSVRDGDKEKLVLVAELKRSALRSFDLTAITSAICEAVGSQMALQIDTIVLIKPVSLPKTSSGKIQRTKVKQLMIDAALDSVAHWSASGSVSSEKTVLSTDASDVAIVRKQSTSSSVYVPPSTEIEIQMTRIWETILERSRIGIHDNFFALGGHSIHATQIASRIKDTFYVDISMVDLFEITTIHALCKLVEDKQLKRLGEVDEALLSQLLDEMGVGMETIVA